MGLLARLRNHRNDLPQEPTDTPQEPQDEGQGQDANEREEAMKERISGFLYGDERLIEELLPVFMRLEEVEGADSIFELIEAKETQLSNVLDNEEAFSQDSNPDDKNIPADNSGDEDDDDNEDYVMKILEQKYGE